MADFQHEHKRNSIESTTTQHDVDVDAEHDPEVSRRASLADLRRYTSQGAVPAPLQNFATPTATASERAFGRNTQAVGPGEQDAAMDAAAQPVKAPLPKAKAGKGAPVSADQAPTVEDVFDPQRPALDGASQDTVLAIIQQNVNDLYQEVLLGQLDDLKKDLAKTAPVPETPFAMKLLAWVVETVASSAVGYIGGFLGKELFGHAAPTETTVSIGGTESEPVVTTSTKTGPTPPPNPREKAVEKVGETGGEKAGGFLKEKMLERPTTAPSAEETPPAVSTGNLLDEFIVRERHMLLAKKSDIMARLMLMHEHASGRAKTDTVKLGNQLRDLIGAPALTAWFRNKVAMEWLNFVARVSLGPRAQGQFTDMLGANTLGGIADGGVEAQRQWRGADGMIEIMLNVAETVTGTKGVTLNRATIPSSYGAAQILQRLQGFNLGTMPVYRRVWLKTGESKLDEEPAFVITPDGAIEADVGNPVLAAIGSGKPTHVDEGGLGYTLGGNRFTDEQRKDPNAWSKRAIDSAHCTTGARMIQDAVLNGVSPQVLK